MKALFRFKQGFTLVELVMVMVIIGLLAAIIIPNFTGQKDSASIAATKANLENIRTAVALYYAQEGEWPSASLAELWDPASPSPSGNIYMRAIPPCVAYDPSRTPVDPSNDVQDGTAADEATGWYWDTAGDHLVHPNRIGSDAEGTLFSDY